MRDALACTYGPAEVECLGTVARGASGAVAIPIRARGRTHLLRVETHRHPSRNPHQYACMAIAAEGGVAPVLHFADEKAGVAIMDYVAPVPIEHFPGGAPALARALGALAARLQASQPFPAHGDFRARVGNMLAAMGRYFEPGLLDRHQQGLDRLVREMRWEPDRHVSAHNDLSPRNLVFDGRRLWLVDWETACRNDAFADIAILADNFAATPDLAYLLTQSWLGRVPTAAETLHLAQMTALTRLYYAGLMMASAGAPAERMTRLDAPTVGEFGLMLERGELQATSRDARIVRGRMYLAAFRAALDEADGLT